MRKFCGLRGRDLRRKNALRRRRRKQPAQALEMLLPRCQDRSSSVTEPFNAHCLNMVFRNDVKRSENIAENKEGKVAALPVVWVWVAPQP